MAGTGAKVTGMDVLGKALLDFHQGLGGSLRSHSSLGEEEAVDPAWFFRDYDEMPELEQRALDMARGPVLDVGCGAGSHCLYLQGRGLACTGLDISPGAVRTAGLRGVQDVRKGDFRDLKVGDFATVLLLMNGAGLAGTLSNLAPFLRHLSGLLAPGGSILLDSSDIRYMFDADADGGLWVPGDREYYGEVTYIWEYNGVRGKPFPWLFADFSALEREAHRAGLQAEFVAEGPHFDYLARLSPA